MNATRGGVLLLWLAGAAVPAGAVITAQQTPSENQGNQQEKEPKPPVQLFTVAGRVRDSEARGVSRAQVAIAGPNNVTAETSTDESGTFSFTGPAGNYQIAVRSAEKVGAFRAAIANGRLTPSDFTLR